VFAPSTAAKSFATEGFSAIHNFIVLKIESLRDVVAADYADLR
jgi:hypothetical protein